MATRVVQILSDFIRWRWAPFVGIVGASLFYVLFAILLIPSQVGASEPEEETPALDASETTRERTDESENSDTDAKTTAPSQVKHIERSTPLQSAPAPKRRGFSPPLERPDPTPPPPPPPPPPVAQEAPAPAPAPQAPAPPATDPAAADEQQRVGAAAAARAATLAATRASRLAGRGLRPRMPQEAPADAPVHEDSELAEDDEESEAPDANANQTEAADDSQSGEGNDAEPAETEQQADEDE